MVDKLLQLMGGVIDDDDITQSSTNRHPIDDENYNIATETVVGSVQYSHELRSVTVANT